MTFFQGHVECGKDGHRQLKLNLKTFRIFVEMSCFSFWSM